MIGVWVNGVYVEPEHAAEAVGVAHRNVLQGKLNINRRYQIQMSLT